VPERSSFDYALIRVVPRVERGEYINAGVLLFCKSRDFLAARTHLDVARLTALSPGVDAGPIGAHLATFTQVAAGGAGSGPIGALTQTERFHWLVAPRSTVVQVSPVHSGLCEDPRATLEELFSRMVA
jgi:hypothetical protein